jgi:hypothetical protein
MEDNSKLEDAYLKGITENNNLRHQIRSIKSRLQKIRDDPNWWKAGEISGADAYQGLPPFLRVIDEILDEK